MTIATLRNWRLWAITVLTLLLIAGWSLAFYNLSVSQHNATTAATLKQDNDSLTTRLDDVTRDRNTLRANQSAIETGAKRREDEAKRLADSAKQQATDLQKREDEIKKREDAVAEQERIQAQNTITEGNWAVGVDIQPGTYRTKDAVSGSCYWEINSDANGDNIVANDIVDGGRPTVTLKNGQFFKTSRCGEWIKV